MQLPRSEELRLIEEFVSSGRVHRITPEETEAYTQQQVNKFLRTFKSRNPFDSKQ